jgi:hypothetical protein
VLGPPTWCTLTDLARFTSVAAVLTWGRERDIVCTELEYRRTDGVEMLVLPGDPLHSQRVSAAAGGTRFVLEDGRWRACRFEADEKG